MTVGFHVPAGDDRTAAVLACLRGLAVGDALGTRLAAPAHHALARRRELPPGTWRWTDDTEMACSVVAVAAAHGRVDQEALADSFAAHHEEDGHDRGYGRAVHGMLRQIRENGADWRDLAASLFGGRGSWGNGAAMRVAPLGVWFAGDPGRAAEEAEASAYVTHQHREAVAGARAVAAAASLLAGPTAPDEGAVPGGSDCAALLEQVQEFVPRSAVRAGLRRAGDVLDYADVGTVAAVLGCGRRKSAHDTVPFALWAAARHLRGYEEAVWTAVRAGGDIDTTCALIGGVVAAGGPAGAPPETWTARTEELPSWLATSLTRLGQERR